MSVHVFVLWSSFDTHIVSIDCFTVCPALAKLKASPASNSAHMHLTLHDVQPILIESLHDNCGVLTAQQA